LGLKFYIVHPEQYISISTISTNKCTHPSFNSQ